MHALPAGKGPVRVVFASRRGRDAADHEIVDILSEDEEPSTLRVVTSDNALETFPSNLIAGLFHFNPREYFQTEEATREAPRVSFTDEAPPAAATPPPEAPASPSPPTQ